MKQGNDNDPSGVSLADLIHNDLTVVKQYLDLATRHDQLVTEVEKKLQLQAR